MKEIISKEYGIVPIKLHSDVWLKDKEGLYNDYNHVSTETINGIEIDIFINTKQEKFCIIVYIPLKFTCVDPIEKNTMETLSASRYGDWVGFNDCYELIDFKVYCNGIEYKLGYFWCGGGYIGDDYCRYHHTISDEDNFTFYEFDTYTLSH